MNIRVVASADEVSENIVKDKTAIIIDVLRATSTITTSLANGSKGVIPAHSIERAKQITQTLSDKFILGGERNAVKIEGFDCGNSPLEYTNKKVKGKYVIITTTNGTRAIHKAESASQIIAASFLNGKAICNYIKEKNYNDIVIICAGTGGMFSLDDILCAGKIIYHLLDMQSQITLNDLAIASENIYKNNKDCMHDILKNSFHYKRLSLLGFGEDLKFCIKQDIFNIVPVFKDGIISLDSH